MIAMAALAVLARDITLWGLIELKMELLVQCVPAFLVAIHWRRFRAKPAFIGLALGTAIAVAGVFAGMKRIEGLHIGLIGLAVNVGRRLHRVAAAGEGGRKRSAQRGVARAECKRRRRAQRAVRRANPSTSGLRLARPGSPGTSKT